MIAQALALKGTAIDRLTLDMERWLSGDTTVNLAPDMYLGDQDDRRWRKGHSSKSYYVEQDELATLAIAVNEIEANAQNFFDMGVGGENAVLKKGLQLADRVHAKNYLAFDLAAPLANKARELASARRGLNSVSVICDIFEPLPLRRRNVFLALLGLTLGNIETLDDIESAQHRFAKIFANYARAATATDLLSAVRSRASHLLISYDANRDLDEVTRCYDNPEFGGLVRGCVGKGIDTSGFDYDVVTRETPEILFLSTGLRAKNDQIIRFNGREFPIERDQFLPVLNSNRFSIPFITETARRAGWETQKTWSATGRVQYQHFTIE